MFGPKLTPTEKAERRDARERQREKNREEAARRAEIRRQEEARMAVVRAEQRRERFETMPYFTVRETREVTVKANDMQDAIALAAAAFKEGQNTDGSIKWGRPFGVEGNTVDNIRIVNVRAVETEYDD
jgi:hypothetical protein